MERLYDLMILKLKIQISPTFHYPISINNIDINKIVVINKVFFSKRILNILLATKMLKKLDLYAYIFQK